MPLPVIADVLRVAVEGQAANGHQWANVMHFRKSGILTFAAAIASLDPLLASHYSTNVASGNSWHQLATTTDKVTQIRYTPLDGTSATVVNTHAITGVNTGDPLPAEVALVVTLRTGRRGRSFRGRVYVGPINEAINVPPGVPNAANVADTATQWNTFLTNLVGSGVSLVVASYTLLLATDVTTCTVDQIWDSQRRRQHP